MTFKKGDLVRDKVFPDSIGILVDPGSVVVDKVIFPKVQWFIHPAVSFSPGAIAYASPDRLERIITDEVW